VIPFRPTEISFRPTEIPFRPTEIPFRPTEIPFRPTEISDLGYNVIQLSKYPSLLDFQVARPVEPATSIRKYFTSCSSSLISARSSSMSSVVPSGRTSTTTSPWISVDSPFGK
jgi:hypothetical protein